MSGLELAREGAVMRMTLDRPQSANAIDLSLAEALAEAAILCDEDDAIRCVLLSGAGGAFCAGGDLASFAAAGEDAPAHLKRLTGFLHVAIARLARMPKPLVTAVNGPAAGAGMSLAILGDLVLAARSSHFTPAYGAIGLTPDGGATWLLPRLIGLRKTQELLMMNKRVTANEAVAIGLATRVVDDGELDQEAMSVAVKLAAGPTRALGEARRLLLGSWGLETQMELEARAIADAIRHPHGQAGVAAFFAKRPPRFC